MCCYRHRDSLQQSRSQIVLRSSIFIDKDIASWVMEHGVCSTWWYINFKSVLYFEAGLHTQFLSYRMHINLLVMTRTQLTHLRYEVVKIRRHDTGLRATHRNNRSVFPNFAAISVIDLDCVKRHKMCVLQIVTFYSYIKLLPLGLRTSLLMFWHYSIYTTFSDLVIFFFAKEWANLLSRYLSLWFNSYARRLFVEIQPLYLHTDESLREKTMMMWPFLDFDVLVKKNHFHTTKYWKDGTRGGGSKCLRYGKVFSLYSTFSFTLISWSSYRHGHGLL